MDQFQFLIDYIIRIINGLLLRGVGAFCWNANGCWQEGGRGQKLWKYADVDNMFKFDFNKKS